MMNGTLKKFQSFLLTDLRNINRDDFLSYIIMVPLALGLLARWLVPYLTDLLKNYHFDLLPYYPLIVSYFFVLMIPGIIGFVNGFIWIDERDDRTLHALQVTPLPFIQYLTYKILTGMLLSVVLILIVVPLSNLATLSIFDLIIVAVLGSFAAPFFALILFIFAKNKVEAFAIAKYMYVLYLTPIAAFFISSPWEFLFGLIPTYWILKVFWLVSEKGPDIWLYYTIGFIYHLVILAGLLIHLKKVAYKN